MSEGTPEGAPAPAPAYAAVPPSRPLRLIGWGLVLAFFDLRLGWFDVLPDALGWFLVALGAGRLPVAVAGERTVALARVARGAAAVAAVVSLPELVGFRMSFAAGDPVPAGAIVLVLLAGVLFTVAGTALARAVEGLATAAGDVDAQQSWRTVGTAFLVVSAVGDVLAVGTAASGGAGVPLVVVGFLAGAVVTVWLTYRCFTDSARPWVLAP